MSASESVILAFGNLWETAQTSQFTVGFEFFSTACDNFMGVCLMAHIPYEFVRWRVVYVVQCDGEFHRAEARAEMARVLGQLFDYETPQLGAECRQFVDPKTLQVLRRIDIM